MQWYEEVIDRIYTHKLSHAVVVIDDVLNSCVGQVESDLQQIHPKHNLYSPCRTSAFTRRIIRFYERNPAVLGNNSIHTIKEFFLFTVHSGIILSVF